jgi:uncharacterized protein (UPF0335 family)
MKKLKLRDEDQVSPEERVTLLGEATTKVVEAIIQKAVDDAGVQGNMLHAVSVERMRSFVERVERLREDQQAITADINEVMQEAKGEGYDASTIRDIIKLRAMDDYRHKLGLLKLYAESLGMEWPD